MTLPDNLVGGTRSVSVSVSAEEEASGHFVQRMNGPWTEADQEQLERRLHADRSYADAYRRVQESWDALDIQAESPELMRHRAEALNYARSTHGRRWLGTAGHSTQRIAASLVLGILSLALLWQVSPHGYRAGHYATDIGEQRMIELDDHTRIALDAATRLRVRYTDDFRLIELEQGQAQFSVAKDPKRPFKVVAGGQAIIALGTVFTVDYEDRNVHVAMLEGRVAVVPRALPASLRNESGTGGQSRVPEIQRVQAAEAIELSAGQELRINREGRATFNGQADLDAVTAWRQGKVVMRDQTVAEAAQRFNRYSRLQIHIGNPILASRKVSGVFEAGDTQGFVAAIRRLYPVTAEYIDSETLRLDSAPENNR